jgi:putative nucleotidyltransferase with HDIG domain
MSFCDEKNISASYIDEYPLTFKNEAGEADGFAIDLLNYIFEKEGIVVTYKHMTWSDALKSVDDKTVDLIIDILKTDDRLEKYDFNNEPFFFGWGTLIAYNDNSIENILDLNGKTIGYLRDDNYAVGPNGLVENINRFNISTDYLAYNDYGSILEALNNNVLDAAIVSRLMESQLHNYRNIKKTGIVFAPGGFFIAGPKGSNKVLLDTVDQYLRQLKADEESFFYDRYNYWFKSLQPNLIRDFYYENKVSIFIIGFLIVFFLGFSRYEVYRKSKDLRATNELLSKHVNQLNNANEELESAYQDIDLLVEKYDLLIHFLSSNPYAVYECDESFMKRLLSISYSLLDGVDFAFAYKTLNHSTLKIIDLIGYKPFSSLQLDLSRLNVLKEGIFIKSDFYENLLLTAKDESTNLIIRELMTMTKETLIINFNSKEYHYGILLNIKKSSEQSFNRTAKEVMSAFKNVADTYFIIKHLFAKHNQFQKEMLHSINEMLEIHDEYTRGHSENVANLAKALAEYVDLSAESVDTTYWAALVHDIGKILIPSHILNKKGALTDLEYTEMKNHPYYGYKALRTSDLTKDIAEIVLCHHERFDGLGYPNQLAGDDIPIESKILTIADAYDAMTSKRSYKTALTIEEAFEEIENNLGKQFDPDLGEKFIEMLKKQKL